MNTSDYDHISNDIRHLISGSDYDRSQFILSDRYIYYSQVEDIINHVEYLMLQPPQMRAWGLTIIGSPGAGKTSLAHAIKRRLVSTLDQGVDRPQVPVVMISMTNAREARSIYNRIFDQLGVTAYSTIRRADREQLAVRILRESNTKLLLVDEIQDVLATTKYQQRVALDTIKFIMNTLSIPIVALGAEGAGNAMCSDPHLRARFNYKALPTWGVDNSTQGLLRAMERTLPLKKPSNLSSLTLMKRIIKDSDCSLSGIVRLINNAAIHAIADGREHIDEDMLTAAKNGAPPARLLRKPTQMLEMENT